MKINIIYIKYNPLTIQYEFVNITATAIITIVTFYNCVKYKKRI